MKKLLPLILLLVLALPAKAQVFPAGLIRLNGLYLEPVNDSWDFQAPSLAPGCLQVDAQGHFASTGANCASGNASTSPGGLTGQIQFAGFGSFVGDSNLTFSSTTGGTLSVAAIISTASSTASSTISRFNFVNATGTSATTTNFSSTSGTFTNLFGGATALTGALNLGSNTITSGLINSQTISSLANFTGTLTATGGLTSLSNLLLSGSTTLQNFTGVNATTSSLVTTSLTLNGLSVSPIVSTTTAALGGGLLTAGNCQSVTATTTTTISSSMVVVVTPVTYPGDGSDWSAYIGANNTVVVKICALVTVTPVSTQYNVRVIP